MFKRFRQMLVGRDKRELEEATENFDRLMKLVESDDLDLDALERHVDVEFEELDEAVGEIRDEVDEAMGNEAL